jgi:hypothetical protein
MLREVAAARRDMQGRRPMASTARRTVRSAPTVMASAASDQTARSARLSPI